MASLGDTTWKPCFLKQSHWERASLFNDPQLTTENGRLSALFFSGRFQIAVGQSGTEAEGGGLT
jgi:hypothetical protein